MTATKPKAFGYTKGPFFSVVVNAGWLTGARLAPDIANFLLFIALSRRFGPIGIGQYAYGMAIALLVYTLVNLGIEEYGIREYAKRPAGDRERFFEKLLSIQLGSIVPVLAGLALFLFLSNPSREIAYTTVILTAYFLFVNLSDTLFIPAYAHQSVAVVSIAGFLCRVGAILVSLLLIWRGNVSLPVALLPLPVFGCVLLLVAYVSASRRNGSIRFRADRGEISEIIRVSWPFAASGMVFYVYSRVNVILVSAMLGDAAAGYYFTGMKFLETGAIPLHLLGFASYPVLSRNFERKDGAFLSGAEKLMRLDLIVGGLLLWALFFFVPMVMAPVLGSKFVAATPVVRGVAFLALLTAVESVVVRILFAMGLQATRLKIQAVIAALNILLGILLIPYLGVMGAVLSMAVTQLLLGFLYLFSLRLRREPVLRCLLKPLRSFLVIIALVVAATGVLSLRIRQEWLQAAAFLAVFFGAILGTGFLPYLKLEEAPRSTTS